MKKGIIFLYRTTIRNSYIHVHDKKKGD